MYRANFNDLMQVLGPVRAQELQPFIDQLRGKKFHHITGPNPPTAVIELIARWINIGAQLGFTCTWERVWADKTFEEACDVMSLDSVSPNLAWSKTLEQSYQEGFEFGQASLQSSLWGVDALFIHEVSMLPLVRRRSRAHWVYLSHDYLGHASRAFWERFLPDLEQFDATIFPNASFVVSGLPYPQLWQPTVDILSPRNRELEQIDSEKLWPLLQLPEKLSYLLYADRHDRLEHAEELLTYYLKHDLGKNLSLIIALEAGANSPAAERRARALEQISGRDPKVFIRLLPQNEALFNALRRGSAMQVYWPKQGRSDLSLIEALWAGRPVLTLDQLGVRDIVRAGVTALVAKTPADLLTDALRLQQDDKLARGLVERARMHTLDTALIDQELINLACLCALRGGTAETVDWSTSVLTTF